MDPDEVEPEAEPLVFYIHDEDVPPEVYEAKAHIKQIAEKLLYHWKNFPIALPPSVTQSQLENGTVDEGVISFKDLFKAPTFDEVEEVARDENGQTKSLSDSQLEAIRKNGEFDVPSIHFPGQVHKWRLSLLLQKGTQRARETLLNDMALALRLLVITARNRFHSHFFSLSQSLHSIKKGLWQILDILIGMPSTTPGSVFKKLHDEHSRFLVAELNIKPTCHQSWVNYCEYIKDKCNPTDEDSAKNKTTDLKPPPVPYKFLTTTGSDIDLRLFNRDLMVKCTDVLKKILEKESKGWYIKYKDRLITELKGQNFSYDEITQHVNKAIREEYLRRVFQTIQISEELEEIQPRIGKLLVDQATSALLMEKALDNVREKLLLHQQEHKSLLISNYPVRSRITAWMNERLHEFEEEFIEQNQWVAHEESLEECRRNNLDQAIYFLQRDLSFLRDREPVLLKELGKVKNPNRVFSFSTRIWFPKNYIVKRHMYGETDIIPTVITQAPLTNLVGNVGSNTLQYTVDKHTARKTSTHYPFWRWVNYFHRTWAWTWNAMFTLGIVVPWCSPVSLRALVFREPFMPDLVLDHVNGSLCPRASSLTQTMVSRLIALWEHIFRSRTRFESEADTGFLGKSFTRHVNRFWNYVLKGAFGSFGLVVTMVPVCLISSVLSVIGAVTAPLWMPVVTICAHVAAVLCYDYDHPAGNAIMYVFEAILFRLLFQGCIQPVCALVTAVVFLPLSAFFVMLAGVIKRGGRATWDAFMFYAVIKKRGRVPCRDGFVARRIEGPGLASNYYFQVKPAQILAAVEAQVELHELEAWQQNTQKLINKPVDEYRKFVKQCFSAFSASAVGGHVFTKLEKETSEITKALQKQSQERRKMLHTGLSEDSRGRIKLSARELKVTIAQTAKVLDGFYPDHVLRRLTVSQEDFWENRHLEQNDWQGLATQLLTEIFSSSFLTPLEDTDTCFKLEVEHLNLRRYLEMLKSAEFRDDLDVVNTVHTPKGDIDVDAPYMELYVFSPRKERINYDTTFMSARRKQARLKPWKRRTIMLKEIEKLEVPLPVAHPSIISALINNRDCDQEPIDLENPICDKIFVVTERLRYVEVRDCNTADLLYETEGSTPEHTTSEPDIPLSHLAEQESSAFSSDNLQSVSPDSVPETRILAATTEMSTPDDTDSDEDTGSETEENNLKSEQVCSRVLYHENEANTSCVLQIDEDDNNQTPGPSGDKVSVDIDHLKTFSVSEDSEADGDDEFDDARDFPEGFHSMFARKQSLDQGPRSGTI